MVKNSKTTPPKSIRKSPGFKRWQLQDAKARFSHVVDQSRQHGPQIVTRHGKDVAAIIPIEDLHKVTSPSPTREGKPGRNSLAYLLKCPKGPDLKIRRSPDDNILNRPPVFD